jgi:hypothetical protein
VHWIF